MVKEDAFASHCSPRLTTTDPLQWIDLFAVRQWPGNGADLDFRGVLSGCTAAIVAAAPFKGPLSEDTEFSAEAFLKTDDYTAAARVLPFCRLWCIVVSQGSRSLLAPAPQNALTTSPGNERCARHGQAADFFVRSCGAGRRARRPSKGASASCSW